MPQVNTGRVLIFVICISTSTIPIQMVLMPNTEETSANSDIPTVERTTSEIFDMNSSEITHLDSCVYTKKGTEPLITARCNKMFNESYIGLNIDDFVLEISENLTLGPHEFHAHNHHYSVSITITNQPNIFDSTVPEWSQSYIFDTPDYYGRLNIHPDIFQNNSQLNRLTIYKYKHFMDDCNSTRNYLFDARNLTELILSVSDYQCWSSSSFSKMPNLSFLFLQSPSFTIKPGIFTPLRNLVKLRMREISNLNILQNTFDGINLQELIVEYCVLKSLAKIQAPALKNLLLKRNSIKHISKNDFIGLPALEKLVIVDGIETIHEDAFIHLMHLERLEIQQSNIVSFTQNHLRNNFQLKVLIMVKNRKIKYLPVFKLNSSRENYEISEFVCEDCGLRRIREGTFDSMPKLKKLSLYKNGLRELPRAFFKSLPLLEFLDLSKNMITNIPDKMFEGAIALVRLGLAENPIKMLKITPFQRTPKLTTLDISTCQIRTWSSQASVNSLQYLSIHANELRHITVEHLKTVPNLKELKALDNPIQCDPVLRNTLNWAKSHHIMTQFYVSSSLICVPDGDKKSCWEEFEKVICSPNYISELESLKNDVRQERSKYILAYNNQSYMYTNKNTINNTSSAHMIVDPSNGVSQTSSNNITTKAKSISIVPEVKSINKSAMRTFSFFVIIVSIIFTSIIT